MGAPNPMRYKCKSGGCFFETLHPPLEMFASAFGGKIAMSDIDGIVERRGHFLVVEWKVKPGKVLKAQDILLKTLARDPSFKVVVITSPVNTNLIQMDTVVEVQLVRSDEIKPAWEYSVEKLKGHFEKWFKDVEKCGPAEPCCPSHGPSCGQRAPPYL